MSISNSYIKKKAETPELKLSTLTKLHDLFQDKGWVIDEDSSISYFNRYVQTLLTLQQEQQDFLVDLSHGFIHLPTPTYLDLLIKPLEQLRAEDGNTNLLFACCLPKEDIGKTKSSQAVLYQLKGSSIKTKVDIKPAFVIEAWDGFTWDQLVSSKNFRIILVDDFIGTGETAIAAADYIKELFPEMNPQLISFLCIVAMKEGITKIEANGYKVYSSIQCGRGISDAFTGEELKKATQNMQTIETTLKLKDENKFGYKQSEALVCMERCPNNTFPIYWITPKKAPYER